MVPGLGFAGERGDISLQFNGMFTSCGVHNGLDEEN